MFKDIVTIIDQFNFCLDSIEKDFRYAFYGTCYILTSLYIISKLIYIIFKPIIFNYHIMNNPIAYEIDCLLYWIYFTWLIVLITRPIRKRLIEMIK